jgi:hypothetical protein
MHFAGRPCSCSLLTEPFVSVLMQFRFQNAQRGLLYVFQGIAFLVQGCVPYLCPVCCAYLREAFLAACSWLSLSFASIASILLRSFFFCCINLQ